MPRRTGLGMLTLSFALLYGNVALADAIVTDANIVTGLDISYSIGPDEMRLEIEGMARAIRSPEVLAAIQSGRYGRIGFTVFAWHHNHFPMVVPWAVIASKADALAVAREIEARLQVNVEMEARQKEAYYIGRLTNLSQAIDQATKLVEAAPYAAERAVINIIGNGDDNVGEEAAIARDRAVAMGATVNGVVLGDDPLVLDYYRQQVIGGPGAFVFATGDAASLVEAMTRKFLSDMVVAARGNLIAGTVEERMKALLSAIVAWLSITFGLPASYHHPRIEFASADQLFELRHGSTGMESRPEVLAGGFTFQVRHRVDERRPPRGSGRRGTSQDLLEA